MTSGADPDGDGRARGRQRRAEGLPPGGVCVLVGLALLVWGTCVLYLLTTLCAMFADAPPAVSGTLFGALLTFVLYAALAFGGREPSGLASPCGWAVPSLFALSGIAAGTALGVANGVGHGLRLGAMVAIVGWATYWLTSVATKPGVPPGQDGDPGP